MAMVPFWDDFKTPDRWSIVLSIVCLFLLTLYSLLIFFFAFCKSGDMALKNREATEEKNLDKLQKIHESILVAEDLRGSSAHKLNFIRQQSSRNQSQQEKIV